MNAYGNDKDIDKEALTLRKITKDDIKTKIITKGQAINYSVNLFRSKGTELGWNSKRTRPRDPDEIKALNYLARKTLYDALNNGSVFYDKESRVLSFAKYRKS
jgi:hypothetical protein